MAIRKLARGTQMNPEGPASGGQIQTYSKTYSICLGNFSMRERNMPRISSVYKPRKPQESQYYQCIEDNVENPEQVYDDRFSKKYGFFRSYIKQVIYRYLDCGILHNGFARVKCEECGHEFLLAFSCKRRHFCPSCVSANSSTLQGAGNFQLLRGEIPGQ